ncbi:MAG: hypothetical protein DLM69_11920 [Candidatus Chloroheliales bacterium]|nr:MAG: hypothetical protein DLM69_11920 [Chloroflexota bacterium]
MKKNVIAGIAVLFIIAWLVACDNLPPQPIIKSDDAIRLAKQAAALQKSPPRRADEGVIGGLTTSTEVRYSYPNEVALWPDTPGTAVVQLPAGVWLSHTGNFGRQLNTTATSVTLETRVESDASGSGVLVTFTASWLARGDSTASHNWQFHVDSAKKASFVSEKGNDLPQLIQVVFLVL